MSMLGSVGIWVSVICVGVSLRCCNLSWCNDGWHHVVGDAIMGWHNLVAFSMRGFV